MLGCVCVDLVCAKCFNAHARVRTFNWMLCIRICPFACTHHMHNTLYICIIVAACAAHIKRPRWPLISWAHTISSGEHNPRGDGQKIEREGQRVKRMRGQEKKISYLRAPRPKIVLASAREQTYTAKLTQRYTAPVVRAF